MKERIMRRCKTVSVSIALIFILIIISVASSHAQSCDDKIFVKDEYGNTILEVQSINMGRTPYKVFTTWDWRKKFANNFFKETVNNVSNSEVRFLKAHYKVHRSHTKVCTDQNGNKYVCGKYAEKTVHYSDKITALEVNGRSTNIIMPGQMSEKQGATNFSKDDFAGKIDTSTIYVDYEGGEYSFVFCRQYR